MPELMRSNCGTLVNRQVGMSPYVDLPIGLYWFGHAAPTHPFLPQNMGRRGCPAAVQRRLSKRLGSASDGHRFGNDSQARRSPPGRIVELRENPSRQTNGGADD